MHRLFFYTLVLLPAVVASSGLYAIEEDPVFGELPVILSVTRLPQSIQDTPAAVSVINRGMIEASGAREIPELLRLVAGIQVGHVNILGPRVTVTYHGLSDHFSRRMQVLIDGRSVYTPATGGVNWHTLPVTLDDIERIEVIRGPNGVSHGANSFLGVINILTYHSTEVEGTTIRSVNGDGGYQRQLLRHAGQIAGLSLAATMEYMEEESNRPYELGVPGSIKDNKRIAKAIIRGDYRHSVNDYYSFNIGDADATLGDGITGDPTTPTHDIDTNDTTLQLKWKRLIDTEQDIQLNLYQTRYSTDGDYIIPRLSSLFSLDPLIVEALFGEDSDIHIDHDIEMQRRSVELQQRMAVTDNLRLVWGAEYREDEVVSPGLIGANSPVRTRLGRFFINGAWQTTEAMLLNLGVMREDHSLSGVQLSPRYAVNYKVGRNHSVRAAHTIAYRTPAILEEYADYAARFYPSGVTVDQIWESSGGLEPEKISSTEIGLSGMSSKQRLQYDVRIFREHINNIIATPYDSQSDEYASTIPGACSLHEGFCVIQAKFFNNGYADLEGVDLQLQLRSGSGTNLSLGYAYVEASGRHLSVVAADVPVEYLNVEDEVPSNTASLLLSHGFTAQSQASIGWYYVDKMQFIGGDVIQDLSTVDVSLNLKLQYQGVNGDLRFTVQDANGSYYDFTKTIPRTRRAFFGLNLDF